jgi:hypothetical protein
MTFLGAKFSALATMLVLIFTAVEVLTMVLWLIYAEKMSQSGRIVAVVILAVGLTIEHFLSAATGVHISK